MNPRKLPYLEKRVSETFSLKRRTIFAFKERVDKLGLDKQIVMEELITQWIIDTNKL